MLSSPSEWEIIRRSAVMLQPGQFALKRETAVALIEELQRLDARNREVRQLVDRLQALLADPAN